MHNKKKALDYVQGLFATENRKYDPELLAPTVERFESAKHYREKKVVPLLARIVKILRVAYRRFLELRNDLYEMQRKYQRERNGGMRFVIDKQRISIRLTAPYSEERRGAARQYAREHSKIMQKNGEEVNRE